MHHHSDEDVILHRLTMAVDDRIPLARPFIDDKMKSAALEVLDSHRWVKGPRNISFGREFAKWCGAEFAIPCVNGSSALIAALRLLNIKEGDEVIVPSLTFIASATSIDIVGATPVFVDVERKYWCLDPQSVRSAITDSTKAILGVHLFGQPFCEEILEISEELKIPLIEDAAQAHGATLNGKLSGSIGDIACFSFFPSKNMAVGGEGGMLTTKRLEIVEQLQSIINHGRSSRYRVDKLSTNLRMSEIQAAIGELQLTHLPDWVNKRREIAMQYTSALQGHPLIEPPLIRNGAGHAWHQYTVKCSVAAQLIQHLDQAGIDSVIHYPIPCHLQPIYSNHPQHSQGTLPITEELSGQLVSIPVHPHLTKQEIEHIISTLCDFHV